MPEAVKMMQKEIGTCPSYPLERRILYNAGLYEAKLEEVV
jgi:hypothetical protein